MSRNLPWYKRDVDAWRGGTRSMSMELRGFYSECLDAMWDLQGPIPDDPVRLAVLLCCSPRTVRKLLPQLVGMGKLIKVQSGYANKRMMVEIGVEIAPEIETVPNTIQREFDPSSIGIRAEFDAKIPKNPMFSTRELEVEVEVEEEGDARARDSVLLSDGKVAIGSGVAADLESDFPGVDLDAVAIRAAVDLGRMHRPTRGMRLAVVRRCALFESQAMKRAPPRDFSKSSQPSVLDIIRGTA